MTTILVVDDAPEVRDVVATFLADEGFEVAACGSAEDALVRLALALPDLLILDGRLPGISGWECLRQLRRSDRTARLPVLMLTAAVDDLEKGRQEPPDDCTTYLAKPFEIDDVLAAIHGVITACDQEPLALGAGVS
ncbi:MAG: response regulator [Chloroflexota bacterium]|nr:response regulator [Chloroflexota bacterium]